MKTIKITLPPAFQTICKYAGVEPKQVIEEFINNLCALDGAIGTDERNLAQEYFDRCYYEGSDQEIEL